MTKFKFNPLTRKFNLVNDSIDLGSNFQGPYGSGTAYTVGQSVSKDGKLYVCLTDSTGNDPPNVTYWDELELQGPMGPGGSDGIDGVAGTDGIDGSKWYTADGIDPNTATLLPVSPTPVEGDQCLATDSKIWRLESSSWVDTGINIQGAAGSGDVNGPGSSTSGNISTFANTTGDLLQDSNKAIANASFKNEAETRSASIDMAGYDVANANLSKYIEPYQTLTTSGGSLAMDPAQSRDFYAALTNGVAVTVSFGTWPVTANRRTSLTLELKQSTTAVAVTWPAEVKWNSAVVPDINVNEAIYFLTFTKRDGDSNVHAFLAGKEMS